jgi:hypothetical protein
VVSEAREEDLSSRSLTDEVQEEDLLRRSFVRWCLEHKRKIFGVEFERPPEFQRVATRADVEAVYVL